MNVRFRITAFLPLLALIVATVMVPSVNASANHACCPPDMVEKMTPVMHQAMGNIDVVMHDNGSDPGERACDMTCCGLVSTSCTIADFENSSLTNIRPAWQENSASQLNSAALAIQSPPPRLF